MSVFDVDKDERRILDRAKVYASGKFRRSAGEIKSDLESDLLGAEKVDILTKDTDIILVGENQPQEDVDKQTVLWANEDHDVTIMTEEELDKLFYDQEEIHRWREWRKSLPK